MLRVVKEGKKICKECKFGILKSKGTAEDGTEVYVCDRCETIFEDDPEDTNLGIPEPKCINCGN